MSKKKRIKKQNKGKQEIEKKRKKRKWERKSGNIRRQIIKMGKEVIKSTK